MKTRARIAALALLLVPAAVQAQSNATLNTSGNWSDATKWSSNPFAPNNGNNGVNWNAIINANTVTVDATRIIESLTLGGGTIQGASALTMNAASTWSGGGMSTAGGVTNFNGGVAITAVGQFLDARTVNLAGTSSIGNGTLNMQNSSTLANSGTFNINNSGASFFNYHSGTQPTVSNSGTINKSGAGTASFSAMLNNTGTVNVDVGVMRVIGGGSGTGIFDIDGGADFRVDGGTYTMDPGVTVNGAGTFNMTGGTTTFNGLPIGTSTGSLGIAGGTMIFQCQGRTSAPRAG